MKTFSIYVGYFLYLAVVFALITGTSDVQHRDGLFLCFLFAAGIGLVIAGSLLSSDDKFLSPVYLYLLLLSAGGLLITLYVMMST